VFVPFFTEFDQLFGELNDAIDEYAYTYNSQNICLLAFKLAKRIRQKCINNNILCIKRYKRIPAIGLPFLRGAITLYQSLVFTNESSMVDIIQDRVDTLETLSRVAYENISTKKKAAWPDGKAWVLHNGKRVYR